MREAVKAELRKFIDGRHAEELITEKMKLRNKIVSPVVFTKKSDGTKVTKDWDWLSGAQPVDTAQDNAIADIGKTNGPDLYQNQLGQTALLISTIDLKQAFGLMKLHSETAVQCVAVIVGGTSTSHYGFLNGFYGLADIHNNMDQLRSLTCLLINPGNT